MKCTICGEKMRCTNTREKENVRYRMYACNNVRCMNESYTIETMMDNALDEAKVIRNLWKICNESREVKGLSATQAGLLQKESERHGIR